MAWAGWTAFSTTFWKGIAIFICIGIVILCGWLFYAKGINVANVVRKVYGKISNPTKAADKSRGAVIFDALAEMWSDTTP